MENPKLKIVYVITDRNGRSYWNRVGVAFTNKDGSLAVKLDAVPMNGELHIRDYAPRDERIEPSMQPAEAPAREDGAPPMHLVEGTPNTALVNQAASGPTTLSQSA